MCVCPLDGWKSKDVNPETGKRRVVFSRHEAEPHMWVSVPCGRCIECRLEKKRQWAMRCTHEASLYDENCFITLTYDERHLPPYGSLDQKEPDDLQLFIKRLRSRNVGKRIRFFASGEYGKLGRAHYHVLLFNFDFCDKKKWSKRGDYEVWHSELLDEIWNKGQTEVGSVTADSASYVAKYVMKDSDVSDDPFFQYMLNEKLWRPPFGRMSRNPGIGKDWCDKFKDEVLENDSVIMNGVEVKPPSYYMSQYEKVDSDKVFWNKIKRKEKTNWYDEIPRMPARQAIAESGVELFSRSGI